jgi:hypothetical protein
MKSKKIILVFMIVLAILGAFCLLIMLLNIISPTQNENLNNNNNNPISSPVSSPDNIIKIPLNDRTAYKYVEITTDDTILMKNDKGEKIVINLERKNWKNLKWSPDGKKVSVLGNTGEGIFNMFIFDLYSENWTKITNYLSNDSGILSYFWKDSSTILYVAKTDSNLWLHSFNYTSGELLKLNIIQGVINDVSNNKKRIILKSTVTGSEIPNFYITDGSGVLIYKFDKIANEKGRLLVITDVIFSRDPDKLLLETTFLGNTFLYEADFGSIVAKPIDSLLSFNSLCTTDEAKFLGYDYVTTENNLKIISLDISNLNFKTIVEKNFDTAITIIPDKTVCVEDGSVLLNLTVAGKNTWYVLNNDKIEEVGIFLNAKEISIRQ